MGEWLPQALQSLSVKSERTVIQAGDFYAACARDVGDGPCPGEHPSLLGVCLSGLSVSCWFSVPKVASCSGCAGQEAECDRGDIPAGANRKDYCGRYRASPLHTLARRELGQANTCRQTVALVPLGT